VLDAHSPVLVPGGTDILLRRKNGNLYYRLVELMAAFQLSSIVDVSTLDRDRQMLRCVRPVLEAEEFWELPYVQNINFNIVRF
jgi:hypothetical protein